MIIIKELDVKSIADYEEYTGHKWRFSERAFEEFESYYKNEDKPLKTWNNTDLMQYWNEYNSLQEFVDAVVAPIVGKTGPISKYVTLTIPETDEEVHEFVWKCVDLCEEHGHTVIPFDYCTKFLVNNIFR